MFSLKKIKRPPELEKKFHDLIMSFLAKLITNHEAIKQEKNLFCYNPQPGYKLLDMDLAKTYSYYKTSNIEFKTKSLAKYILGPSVTIKLLGEGKYIASPYTKTINPDLLCKHYLFPFFEDKQTISDHILYMWYDLINCIGIQLVHEKELNMYIKKQPMDMFSSYMKFSFEYYLDFSRDKLLEKEIELGFTNKVIGDPNRGYGYTHLLRANIGNRMIFPASFIKLLMGWNMYNTYLTSRKQGKTSSAAWLIVCYLLSNKGGYGMRQTKRIKFFTDNAKKVGGEVMEYIKDYLSYLNAKEISPGVKYFDISETNQEVRCNLTGNVFNVISLKGLEGNSDNSTGDGLACDFGIIDEGFRIIGRFWKSFSDRAFEESEAILFISTLNEETQINHWGYEELIKGEAGKSPTHNTVRSSDFDNSITYYNNFKLKGKSIKEFYKYTWNKFEEKKKQTNESYVIKRVMCGILSDNVLFDITGRTTATLGDEKQTDLRIIGVDLGGKYDGLGVSIFNCKTCIVEKSYSIKIGYEEILPLIEKEKSQYSNVYVVGDRGGPVGETIAMGDKNKIFDYWIKNDGNALKINKKNDYYIINKGILVLSGAYSLSQIAKIYIGCNDLIKQFGDMEMTTSSRTNTMLYKGKKGRKDDAVFSFLNIFGLLRLLFDLSTKEDIIEYANEKVNSELISYNDEDVHYYNVSPFIY